MKKLLFLLLLAVVLVGCGDNFSEMDPDTQINKEFQEQAKDLGEELNNIYSNAGTLDDGTMETYHNLVEIDEVAGRELTTEEKVIQQDLQNMVLFINGEHTSNELTFEKVYETFELSLN